MFLESGKNKDNIEKILQYRDRQVVLNWYDDELLYRRDGFFFSEIVLNGHELIFIKDSTPGLSLFISPSHWLEIALEFSDFYRLKEKSKTIEIYFPH